MKKKIFLSAIALLSFKSYAENQTEKGTEPMQTQKETLKPFSSEAQQLVIGGTYVHYSGKNYKVLAVARHSETLAEEVVYQQLYGTNDVWVRPLPMFVEEVAINGVMQPRFKFVNA
jgi:hypothetical protein